MKKNVASQVIGTQMTSSTDGSNFTGSVTVYITGDGGTQAIGTVGSGVCTHEGNGFHSYTPSQAETNYDHIAFTFIGTGAITRTIQVYTGVPQTGDSFARIGSNGAGLTGVGLASSQSFNNTGQSTSLPVNDSSGTTTLLSRLSSARAGYLDNLNGHTPQTGDAYAVVNSGTHGNAALKALIDTLSSYVDTEVSAIKAKTDNLPADPADASDIVAAFSTVNTTLATIAGYLDTEIAAIKAKTDNLPTDPADASDIAASFSSLASTLSTIAAYIDTEIAAIKAKTDQLTFTTANKVDATASVTLSEEDKADIAADTATEVLAGLEGVDVTVLSPVAQDGGDITARQGDAWSIALSGMGNLGSNEVQFSVKREAGDDDDDAILSVRSDTGLVRLNGATTTAGNGSATITNASTGAVTIAVKTAATLVIPDSRYVWAIKKLAGATGATTLAEGEFVVTKQRIEAVS